MWAGLLVGRVLAAVDSLLPTGAAVDGYVRAHTGPRIELSEPLSASAGVYGVRLPRTDDRALAVLRRYGRPAEGLGFGVVAATADGRLAVGVGGGRTIESAGPVLAIVSVPGEGRYTELWEIPGADYERTR